MENIDVFVAGLFYVVAFFCLLAGLYLLYKNVYAWLNRLAFLFAFACFCWCFGAGKSLVGLDSENVLLWRRFAGIGVATFFSFLLHYIILLTEQEDILKKKGMAFLLYLPSAIALYVMVISQTVTHQLYQFRQTKIGWVSTFKVNGWMVFMDIYMISFMAAGLFLVIQWKRRSHEQQKKNQAHRIFIVYEVAFVIAIFAEMLVKINSVSYFHEFAPLAIVLPLASVCYATQKHDFMKNPVENQELIFLDGFRTKIIHYLSISFFAGGILHICAQYAKNHNPNVERMLSFAVILIGFGVAVYLVQKFVLKKQMAIIAYGCLLSVSIPIIMLHYASSTAVTVWAFPFIIAIATLLFNNATVLTMTSASVLTVELYLWIKMPTATVTLDQSDYFTRIGLLGMAITLIFYINRIYILRLNQLSVKISTQDFLSRVSSSIINANYNNLNEKMDEILKMLGEYLGADRVHIYYQTSQEKPTNADYFCWYNEIGSMADCVLQDTSITAFPWWRQQIKKVGMIRIPKVAQMPPEALREKEFLLNQNIQSVVAVPLISNEKKVGFLRVDFVAAPKAWDEEFTEMLKIFGNMLGETNARVSSQEQMFQMAYYDQLTNMPNRQLFGEHMSRAIADRIKKSLRRTDIISRFGGDEFLIMLKDVYTMEDIETVVAKIIGQFDEPLVIDNQETYITASIGIAIFPKNGLNQDALIKNADIAMYTAKSNGKNQFVFCSEKMEEDIQRTMVITQNLYHALENQEFYIAYQPQVSLTDEKIIAVEALARWNNPALGQIAPQVFIPIAEHTGLINDIGEWILREACKQCKAWQDMGLTPVRVAVNVSVRQLLNPAFVNTVMEVLEETRLRPQYLELEVTENIAIQESDYIISVLSKLKVLGVSLAIDDFGMEYSSLSRIKLLPIDRLKIDMHFISGILNSQKDRAIVDVIIRLAKELKISVIAEGVEKEEQLQYLKSKMCDEVQGYYFYRPLSKEDVQRLLQDFS